MSTAPSDLLLWQHFEETGVCISEFSSFLPFSQMMHRQKLSGFFSDKDFTGLLALGITFSRLCVSLEFMEVEVDNVKILGELHIAYTRPCTLCFRMLEKAELVPFSLALFDQETSLGQSRESNLLQPNFLTVKEGVGGLQLSSMIEHCLLRFLPLIDEHQGCCAQKKEWPV